MAPIYIDSNLQVVLKYTDSEFDVVVFCFPYVSCSSWFKSIFTNPWFVSKKFVLTHGGLSLRPAPLYGHSSCGSTTLANENLALWRHFPRISDLRFKGTHPGGSFHGPFSPSAMYILSELQRSQNRAPAWYGNGRSTMAHFMEYSLLVFFNCQILDDSAVPSFSPFSCLMSRLCSPYLSLKVLEVSPK